MDTLYAGKIAITILFGLLLGLVSSIPVGAVQLEVIKKSINGHIKPAIATACGSATSDLIYGMLTLLGFGHFIMKREFQAIIYFLGIIVLSFLLFRAIRERDYMLHPDRRVKYTKRLSFLSGFTIAITNPGMIIWWLIGFRLYVDLGLFTEVSHGVRALFVLSGCVGLGGYLIILASFLHRVKKTISESFLYRTNIFLMVLLGLIILYFIHKLVTLLLPFILHG